MAENLSGVPPQVTLSGLSIGPEGLSGAAQPGARGMSGTSYGGTPFGLPGGADLLSLLLQQAQGVPGETGAGGGILQSLGAGAFGQQPGGISAGSFGQTQPGYVAGQSSQGGAPGTSGSLDPIALLQKILGLGKTGAQVLAGNQQSPAGTSSPTTGASGGVDTSLSDQLRSIVGTASPTAVSDATGLPTGYSLTGGGFSGAEKPGIDFLTNEPYSANVPAGINQILVNQLLGRLGNPATGGAPFTPLIDFSPESLQGFIRSLETSAPGSASLDLIPGSAGGGLSGGGYTGSSVAPPSAVSEGGGLSGLLNSTNLQGLSGALGAGGGIAQLISAIQSGDFSKLPGGAVGAYQGISQLLNSGALGESLKDVIPGISGGGTGINPGALLSSILSLSQGNKLGIGDQAGLKAVTDTISLLQALQASGALTGAVSSVPYAAIVAQAVSDAMNLANFAQGKQSLGMTAAGSVPIVGGFLQAGIQQADKPSSNFLNNPIVGQMYSQASEGIQNTQGLLDAIQARGGLGQFSSQQLEGVLPQLIGNLRPYYASGGTPYSGYTTPGARFKDDPAGAAAYTGSYNTAAQGVSNVVQELMNRGVTYEQLGQLPVPGWASGVNAGGTPAEWLTRDTWGRYIPADRWQSLMSEQNALANQLNLNLTSESIPSSGEGGGWSMTSPKGPEEIRNELLGIALGGSMTAPESVSHASGLMTGMYGGPLWAALARMGVQDEGLRGLIGQHFDPWFTIRTPEYQSRYQPYTTPEPQYVASV